VPSQHLEVERKFDVPTAFALPDLTTVPGVSAVRGPEERSLEAVYHDTADLRLARARVTVRRRTGGPDEGWHVKLPAADGARRELHSPLGKATRTPPKAVSAPVRGLVRSAPLGPVATLQTRRLVSSLCDEAGRVLAEVADDAVTATAHGAAPGEPATVLSWREVEVELVDGDEALLAAVGDRLVQAGAAPSSSASKLARVLAERLAPPDAIAQNGGARNGGARNGSAQKDAGPRRKRTKRAGPTAGAVVLDALAAQVRALQEADLLVRTDQPGGVHDLRVACRRLRSILAAFRPVLDRAQTDPLRDELRWVGQEVSGARDGEVALGHLRALVEAQPVELVLGPVAARLQQTAIQDAEAGRKAAARALEDRRYLRLVDALFELLETPPLTALAEEQARGVLVDAVRRSGKRFRRQLARQEDAHGAPLHDVRKAAKRVRYTAEVAAPVLGGRARRLVKAAKKVQQTLGDRQDTVVTRELCRTIGVAAFGAGENAWTYGRLHGLEEARAGRAEVEFWDRREPALARALAKATAS
jgi:CHAD domain-containing protein